MPEVACPTCGHLTPDEQTYCERCGAPLRERPKPVEGFAVAGGFILGAVAFVFVGGFINALALSAGPHRASGVDFGIVLVLGAAVAIVLRRRKIGSGFIAGLLAGMLGGFAICGGMFMSSRS